MVQKKYNKIDFFGVVFILLLYKMVIIICWKQHYISTFLVGLILYIAALYILIDMIKQNKDYDRLLKVNY